MLVCNVSQARRRAAISADIAELAAAVDDPGTGNVVFATLVDDPASVNEHVDAYLGQIMVESATAASTVNAGLVYAIRVDEVAVTTELYFGSVPTVLSSTMVETTTASALVNASVTAGAGFDGILALDGPITPSSTQPTVIYIDGVT